MTAGARPAAGIVRKRLDELIAERLEWTA